MYPQSMFRATENFQFLQLKKNLHFTWTCFHNVMMTWCKLLRQFSRQMLQYIVYSVKLSVSDSRKGALKTDQINPLVIIRTI